jgi:integrase
MSEPLTDASVRKLAIGKGSLKTATDRVEVPDGGSQGLYLVIQPSGRKSWALRFRRPDGRPAKLVLGSVFTKDGGATEPDDREPEIGGHHTLAGARRLAARLRHDIALGRDPAAAHQQLQKEQRAAQESGPETFAAKARQFIDEYTVPKKGRKPRRWREIARILGLDYPADGGLPTEVKGGLIQRWAERSMKEITSQDIYNVIDEARRSGIPGLEKRNSGVSDARARKMADALGALFGWACRHGQNPVAGVWRPDPPVARDRVLNVKSDTRGADELRWFWAGCDELGEPVGALLKLLLLTGCRLNEVAEMVPDELSDDLATLSLAGQRTKNGLAHDVPLSTLARDILRSVKRIEGCAYVFSRTRHAPISGWSKIKRAIDAAMLEFAKAERGKDAIIKPWRLHDLRRTCATGMAGIGIQPHVIEACLNHISGAKGGVAGVYNRERYEAEKRIAFQQWAEHIDRIVTGHAGKVVTLRATSND